MERKMDFWTIEIATKFKNKEDAERLQKNIIDKFYYECNKNKDYMVQAIVGVSNINGKYVNGIYNKKNGKIGRPKKIKDVMEETEIAKQMYGTLNTDWHLHILVLSSPSDTLAQILKKYIEKKLNISVYRKFVSNAWGDIDIGMLNYIAKQSDSVLFYGSNDKRFKYTFRQVYDEIIKQYGNLKFNEEYITDDNYRAKIDKRYIDMMNYFSQFYSEEVKKKLEQNYKKKVQRRKINERYEEMRIRDEKRNKVLKK